jgi:hypothetical protein
VGALTRVALAVLVVVAAGAAAAVLLLGRSESPPPPIAATAPLVVRAGFDPPTVTFGDRVVARVVILLDRTVVRPDTLRLVPGIAPLTQLSAPRTTRATRGNLSIFTYEVPGVCVTDGCIAPAGDLALRLPRVTATVATRGGGVTRTAIAWPVLHVHGRVNASDLAGARPHFRSDTAPAAPSYRIVPSSLAALFDVLAVLLVLGGVAVAASEARRLVRRRRGRVEVGSELERALRLAREAESRPAPDRRRALGLLARLLDRRDTRLAAEASGLAWAKPQPKPEAMSGLVAEIEQEVPS